MGMSNSLSLPPELEALFWQSVEGDLHAYGSFLRSATCYLRRRLTQTPLSGTAEQLLQEILSALHHKRHTCQSKNDFDQWFHAVVNYKINQCDMISPE